MLSLPQTTEFNRKIPKQKFYENLDVTPAMRRVFVEQIKTVYWKNKLVATTLNIAAGEAVTEIEVLEVRLTQPQLDESVFRQIDREIPYHILFILTCEGKAQAWIGYDERYSMIVLSHNFDFFRTISSRLGLNRKNRLCANATQAGIALTEEHYQNQPFEQWKNHPNQKNIIAMIPFVRNLVQYGKDQRAFLENCEDNDNNSDFDLLTTLLHAKADTSIMRFADLKKIYSAYLGIDLSKLDDVDLNRHIIDTLYEICDNLETTSTELEDKVILAMAIRHKAEEFMKSELCEYDGQLTWRQNNRRNETGTSSQFLLAVDKKGNQTRELLNGYKQIGDPQAITILEDVAIMTPENIHLNSFMYEPIMDMDIVELTALYDRVKTLAGGTT